MKKKIFNLTKEVGSWNCQNPFRVQPNTMVGLGVKLDLISHFFHVQDPTTHSPLKKQYFNSLPQNV